MNLRWHERLRFSLTGRLPDRVLLDDDGSTVASVVASSPASMPLVVPSGGKAVGGIPGARGSTGSAAGDPNVIHAAVAAQANSTINEWSERRAVKDGLKVSTWVYACIYRIAKSAASVPWRVERRVGDDEWEPVKGIHPLTELFNRPNPLWSRQDLIERLTFHLYLAGNGLVHKTRGLGNRIEELWLVSPDVLRPEPDPVEVIKYYRLTSPTRRDIPVDDVVHVMFTDPADPTWGLSPLQVVARAVTSDSKAQDWQTSSMDNRATPDGVLVFGKPLTKEQHQVITKQLEESRSGPANARRVAVLSGSEATWQQLSLSPIEMDFLNSRRMTREEICAVFNVPPPLIGLYDNATLANIETSRRIFWEETVIPYLNDLTESFNRSLAPEFGDDIRIVPDLSQVPALRELVRQSTASAQVLFSMGVPFNDINRRLALGFDRIPGGDVGLVGAGLTPVGMFDGFGPGIGAGEAFGLDAPATTTPSTAGQPATEPDESTFTLPEPTGPKAMLHRFAKAKVAYQDAKGTDDEDAARYRAVMEAERLAIYGYEVSVDD